MTNKKTWLEKEIDQIEEDINVIYSLSYRRHWYEQLTLKRIKKLFKKLSNKNIKEELL